MPLGGNIIIDRADVQVIVWGYRYPVKIGGSLLNRPWRGGTFVRFVGDFTVDLATPEEWNGFLVRSSFGEEGSRSLTSINPQKTGSVALCVFGAYEFLHYETESINLRRAKQGLPALPAPALPAQLLTYSINDMLYVSSNGLLTNEIEVDDPKGVGNVMALPATNQGYLGYAFL